VNTHSEPASSRPPRVVLYEGRGAAHLKTGRRFEVLRELLEAGYAVTRPAPAPSLNHEGAVTESHDEALIVLGEFGGGAPRWEDRAGRAAIEVVDLAHGDPLDRVQSSSEQARAPRQDGWLPWFPVIDYDRCTNCMQCLSFCLFDVYGVDPEGKIQVRNESNCKTNCPACSRVCPDVAILFPKYKKGPINGDQVRSEDVQSEAMKVDISALLGGDIYSTLRDRSQNARKRFSTERDESKALLERKKCLKKLKKDLDIPDEVLMTLPSVGEIEERARRAKKKMEKRKARSKSEQDRRSATTEEWGI
jgi:NAD-dependent dihydropyrimidine dehydrogenase PreA subunit